MTAEIESGNYLVMTAEIEPGNFLVMTAETESGNFLVMTWMPMSFICPGLPSVSL
jgi:hypothetical protein